MLDIITINTITVIGVLDKEFVLFLRGILAFYGDHALG